MEKCLKVRLKDWEVKGKKEEEEKKNQKAGFVIKLRSEPRVINQHTQTDRHKIAIERWTCSQFPKRSMERNQELEDRRATQEPREKRSATVLQSLLAVMWPLPSYVVAERLFKSSHCRLCIQQVHVFVGGGGGKGVPVCWGQLLHVGLLLMAGQKTHRSNTGQVNNMNQHSVILNAPLKQPNGAILHDCTLSFHDHSLTCYHTIVFKNTSQNHTSVFKFVFFLKMVIINTIHLFVVS